MNNEIENAMVESGVSMEQKTVVVSQNKFERHPESYGLRVFVHSPSQENHFVSVYYELLESGQAIPWTESPEGQGFDFWILDIKSLNDLGVHRAKKTNKNDAYVEHTGHQTSAAQIRD